MRFSTRKILASLAMALASGGVAAQTVGTTIAVGTGPRAIAINPITNKIYVANEGSDNVTIISGTTHTTSTVAVNDRPYWLAVNPETGLVYVGNLGSSNTSYIDSSNNVTGPGLSGGVGWTAIDPVNNRAFMIRFGGGDEFNTFIGDHYELTSATRSYEPVSIAYNQVTQVVYVVHKTTGDVTAHDVSANVPYPPLLCPNGTGGLKPNPPPGPPDPGPCINVPDVPMAVAVNPVTNKIYAISSGTSGTVPTAGSISVINGFGQTNPHTFTVLSPSGLPAPSQAVAIAVNPVSNKIYAVFTTHIVIINGADNAMTVLPITNGVGVGINATTNKVYIPSSDGKLTVIDGATNATTNVTIATGAMSVAVNPLTNTIYILTSSGVVPVDGTGTQVTQPLNVSITPLAGNTSGGSGSLTISAANAYPSTSGDGSLANTRRVYYQIDGVDGPWIRAEGSGPFTASFSGLQAGSHTVYAFATNGLDAPSINTDVNISPIVGAVSSYTFSVTSGAAAKMSDLAGDGTSDLIWRNTSTGVVYRFNMNGTAIVSATQVYAEPNTAWKIVGDADFNGDGITDLLWRNSTTGQVYVMPFNSSGVPTTGAIVHAENNPAWRIAYTPDLNGDGNADLLWYNTTTGQAYGMLMNGTSIIGQGVIHNEPNTAWSIAAVGKFSGTQTQLLWYNSSNGQVYRMTVSYSGGSFSQTGAIVYAEPDLAWTILAAADLNGDGVSDLVWRNAANGQIWGQLFASNGTISSQGQIHIEPSSNWQIVSWGDYNGDGKADLLYRNSVTGQVHIQLLNGLAISSQATVYTEPSAQWQLMGPTYYENQQ